MRRTAIVCVLMLSTTAAAVGGSPLKAADAASAANSRNRVVKPHRGTHRRGGHERGSIQHRRGGHHRSGHHRSSRLLVGHRRIGPRVDKSAPGIARVFRFVGRRSGRVAAIDVYLDRRNRAKRVFAAVYTGHKGKPRHRLTSGSLSSPNGGAWNTIRVRRAAVNAGRRYWLAVLGNGGMVRFRDHRGSCTSRSSRRGHLATLPARWRGGRRWRSCRISAYARSAARRGHHGTPGTGSSTRRKGGGSSRGRAAGQGTGGSSRPPIGPARPSCTTTVSSMSALSTAVARAAGGTVICVAPGSYTGMSLSGAHSSDVTIESKPSLDPNGAGKVTIGLSSTLTDGFGNRVAANIAPHSTHIVLLDLYFTNELSIAYGSSFITVAHNDFTQVGSGGGMMINFGTSDCTVPNAPKWSGCQPYAPVSNVTISGNDFHGINGSGADVLHTNNFRALHITANEFSHAVENGNHVDCLQNVFGGNGLTFDHNYEHDNECEGFFLKDGDVTNVTFDENLFVRDNLPATNGGSSSSLSQVVDTNNFVAENNTIWDGKGLVLRCLGSSVRCTATIDHSVFSGLYDGNRGDAVLFALTENHNIFGSSPGLFNAGSTDQVNPRPGFMCGSSCGNGTVAGDDYRLRNNPNGIGINWAPSQYVYGPAG